MTLEATQESPVSVYSTFEEEIEKPMEELKPKLVWDSHNFVWGAFDNDHLVGIAGLHRELGIKICHTAMLRSVYVKSPFRGRGIARQLVTTALDAARGIPGIYQVKLRVPAENETAKRVYLSQGFECYGIDRNVVRIAEQFFHEDLMEIVLTPSTPPPACGAD